MARTVVDIKGLAARSEFPWSEHEIRKLINRPDHPLPFKRCGKKYYFDIERVWRWFDNLPGRDNTT
jgi:hypothetical protein